MESNRWATAIRELLKQAIPGHSLPPRRPPGRINLRPEKEKDFEAKVKKLAHLYGWHGFHISFSHGAVTGVHTLGWVTITTTRTGSLTGSSFAAIASFTEN